MSTRAQEKYYVIRTDEPNPPEQVTAPVVEILEFSSPSHAYAYMQTHPPLRTFVIKGRIVQIRHGFVVEED